MEPTNLYRSQDGCCFEDRQEAINQSVDMMTSEMYDMLTAKSDWFTKDADTVRNLIEEIKAFRKDFNKKFIELDKAIKGELVTTYKLVK